MQRSFGLALFTLLVGCGVRDRDGELVSRAARTVTRTSAFAGAALSEGAHGYVLAKPTTALRVELPSDATKPVRLALPREGFSVEITADDVRVHRAARLSGTALIFPEALPSTDVTWIAARDRVEEIRVLHDARAPAVARFRLRAGPGVEQIRLRAGRVELVAPNGWVGLSSDPMDAIDARGTRRRLEVSLEATGREAIVIAKLDVGGLAYPIALDPVWTTVPSMSVARELHAAALLPSGQVLVAGGTGSAGSTAEIFDPATNTWSAAPSMGGVRESFCLVTASTGKTLAIGGNNGSMEIYDHVTKTWLPGAPPSTARRHFACVPLASGKILSAGGYDGPLLTTSELYDPATNTWTPSGDLATARRYTYGAALPSGKVVLVTGFGGEGGSTAELWDPATSKWSAAGTVPDHSIGLTTLLDGRVLSVTHAGKSALFDGTQWTLTAGGVTVSREFAKGSVQPLVGGKVLVFGGSVGTSQAAEVFDPTTRSFFAVAPLNVGRVSAAFARLNSGAVLVAGGEAGGSTAEIYRSEIGTSCTTNSECYTDHCVDGVCCEAACSGQCEACDVPLNLGRCLPAAGLPHGQRTACASSSDVCKETRCDGVSRTACQFPPATTKCSVSTCKDGAETHEALCDGAGVCGDAPKSCGTFACGATTCKTSCTVHADCAPGLYCKDGGPACVPIEGVGATCTATSTCKSGLTCVDGFCCSAPACSPGSSCGLSGNEGRCAKLGGTGCAASSECGSRNCVDGVCCDAACDGQCEACDVVDATTGRAGRCTPIRGKPHGSRAACASEPTSPCTAAVCDGIDTKACRGFPGSDAECRVSSCKDGQRVLRAVCDGKGACPPEQSGSCGGFACNAAGVDCNTQCDAFSGCLKDYVCKEGKCAPQVAHCSDDGKSSIPSSGDAVSCAPYVCITDGTCGNSCAGSFDCAVAFVCDPVSKACVTPPASSENDAGCTFATSPPGSFAVALCAFSLALLRRNPRPRVGSAVSARRARLPPAGP